MLRFQESLSGAAHGLKPLALTGGPLPDFSFASSDVKRWQALASLQPTSQDEKGSADVAPPPLNVAHRFALCGDKLLH